STCSCSSGASRSGCSAPACRPTEPTAPLSSTKAPDLLVRGLRHGQSPWAPIRSVLLGLATVLGPLHVEGALGVDALVGVRTEVVALGLDQGGREALCAHRVVVGQGRGEHRNGVAARGREGYDAAPCRDALGDLGGEVLVA